ncbi:hypothetical protein [Brachyspira hyodysenteriae]|uniref:hypothetical protein n=1 Tax=Brachyspira hyodysenteriae TaxID=159 RepID=UPI00063D9D90|nr:hypothetical protein [Brachyspira hyodysenteriae]KLI17009.1 hypothetical protein SU45_06515 [Brachyspira hyodysenteriae]KLI30757.1 hypothetical protein SZ49_05580 [Brachyspira hyodysenteriae]KLI54254.1 hypothetical protein SZ43_04420 [Brachyspira hyodysenteriae]KLI59175.1 hypothetical protein SZ46_09255 [Brachyspira hyodysenteriae]MCZ9850183.1 hypothetical protein [Brachyspira hyodysenteriae]
MKKILLLLIISLLFISCWYEDENMGAVIYPQEKNKIRLTLVKRDINNIDNSIVLNYFFYNTNTLQYPETIWKEIIYINGTNIYDKNYCIQKILNENESKKYFNIQAKINDKEIYIKDWDNNEYYLKYTTNTNSWLYTLYMYNVAYGLLVNTNK